MFGGGGLYLHDMMFALITRADVLYLRIDEHNKPDFEDAGMGPFVTNAEKNTIMPYYEVPAEAFEGSDEMCAWARKAIDAARRAHKKKPPLKKKKNR
jgi:DNA transformation protein